MGDSQFNLLYCRSGIRQILLKKTGHISGRPYPRRCEEEKEVFMAGRTADRGGIMIISFSLHHIRSNLARMAASWARVITVSGRKVPSLYPLTTPFATAQRTALR